MQNPGNALCIGVFHVEEETVECTVYFIASAVTGVVNFVDAEVF